MNDYLYHTWLKKEGISTGNENLTHNRDDELHHAKYTSRKWVNGKWRYTYNKPKNGLPVSSKYGIASNWKYLSREKVNGKWKYTYNKPATKNSMTSKTLLGKSAITPPKTKQSTRSSEKEKSPKKLTWDGIKKKVSDIIGKTARDDWKATKQKAEKAKTYLDNAIKKYDNIVDKSIKDKYLSASEKIDIEGSKKYIATQKKQYEDTGREFIAKQEAYFKTPLGKLSAIVEKGKQAFDKIFGKSGTIANLVNNDKKRADDEKRANERAEREKNLYEVKKRTKEIDTVQTPILRKALDKLREFNPFPKLNLKMSPTTYDEDMALVNPNYTTRKEMYDQNCAICTLAYEFRRRGYDVEAKSELATADDGDTGLTSKEISKLYKRDSKVNYFQLGTWTLLYGKDKSDEMYLEKEFGIVTPGRIRERQNTDATVQNMGKDVQKELLSYGDGARGSFNLYWALGGGHSIVWEVEGDRVVFRDTQVNETIDINDYLSKSKDFDYMRTDNLEFSDEAYKYVQNRKRVFQ